MYPCLGVEFGPVKVPDGQLWVMGDNRTHSADSRVALHQHAGDVRAGCGAPATRWPARCRSTMSSARRGSSPGRRRDGVAVELGRSRSMNQGSGGLAGDLAAASGDPQVRRVCARWSRRCTAVGSARWPGSTRWAAAPARDRWWSRPACWARTGWSAWPRSTTPRSSPKGTRGLFPLIRRYALAYHVVSSRRPRSTVGACTWPISRACAARSRASAAPGIRAVRRIPGAGAAGAVAAGDRR